jgi:hypothetical protein
LSAPPAMPRRPSRVGCVRTRARRRDDSVEPRSDNARRPGDRRAFGLILASSSRLRGWMRGLRATARHRLAACPRRRSSGSSSRNPDAHVLRFHTATAPSRKRPRSMSSPSNNQPPSYGGLPASGSAAKPALGVQLPRPRALAVLAVYHEVEGPRRVRLHSPMAGFVCCSPLLDGACQSPRAQRRAEECGACTRCAFKCHL